MKLQAMIIGGMSPVFGILCTIRYLRAYPGHAGRGLGIGLLVVIACLALSYVMDPGGGEREG